MKSAIIKGRFQEITKGRIEDIVIAYNLAFNPTYKFDYSMQLFDSEGSSSLIERKEIVTLGKLDNLVIGIAGADPSNIMPEDTISSPETVLRFINPELNKLTYFQRMIILKEKLIEEGLDISKIDIIPDYPKTLFPSAIERFQPIRSQISFQYHIIESNRHYDRMKKSAKETIALYQDSRNINLEEKENRSKIVFTKETLDVIDKRMFYTLGGKLQPEYVEENGERRYNDETRSNIDSFLEKALKDSIDPVFALISNPLQCDREDDLEFDNKGIFKFTYNELNPLKPYDNYQFLKNYLLSQGINLANTHITMIPSNPNNVNYITACSTKERNDNYLPKTMKNGYCPSAHDMMMEEFWD